MSHGSTGIPVLWIVHLPEEKYQDQNREQQDDEKGHEATAKETSFDSCDDAKFLPPTIPLLSKQLSAHSEATNEENVEQGGASRTHNEEANDDDVVEFQFDESLGQYDSAGEDILWRSTMQ